MSTEINEDRMRKIANHADNMAEQYFKKFRPHIELLEKSPLSKLRSITSYDVYALGKQLESLDTMIQTVWEAEGTVSSLGQIPKIGFDVVSVAYGASIIPLIASVQPIEEESGIVWFKNVRASQTKGNLTQNETFLEPTTPFKTPKNYASGLVEKEVLGTVTGGLETQFTGTLETFPVKRGSCVIYFQNEGAGAYTEKARDNDKGVLVGEGYWGTINYDTGAFVINTAAGLTDENDVIAIDYQEDFEGAEDLPRINVFWDSKNIRAKIYALKGVSGILKNFAMMKRFGGAANDELASDLINAINAEIGGDLVIKMAANVQNNVNYPKATPAEISFYEHRQGFMSAIADAEANMLLAAGRGQITLMVAGTTGCAVLQAVNGFEKMTDGTTFGPHLFGTLNGIPIIRVAESALLDQSTIVCAWRGPSPFEAPVVYSPYMPITTTAILPTGQNPLLQQQAAAVWAGTDVLVPNFITKITIT